MNWLICLGIWGEAIFNLKDLGSKGKIIQGAEDFFFRDFGRSMHYIYGAREHRTPHGGLRSGGWRGRGTPFFDIIPLGFTKVYLYLIV